MVVALCPLLKTDAALLQKVVFDRTSDNLECTNTAACTNQLGGRKKKERKTDHKFHEKVSPAA